MLRVCHLPTPVGHNAWNLSLAEKRNGIISHVFVTYTSIHNANYDTFLHLSKNKFVRYIQVLLFYFKNIRRYDIFHFNWGSSLIESRFDIIKCIDLKLLNFFKKKIVVTYQGSDARIYTKLKEYNEFHYLWNTDKNNELIKHKLKKIEKFSKFADLIYTTNPDLKNILPKRTVFRPYTKLQIKEWSTNYSDYTTEKLKIIHCPTHREKKGTSIVISAIESLISEGFSIDFEVIEGVPNSVALEKYKNCDLVIDQLLIGWYGGVAVECMALGKPVMVYINQSDLQFIPSDMKNELPFIFTNPNTLYDDLKLVIKNKNSLSEIAIKSRLFVEKWHDSNIIAKNIIDDYKSILLKHDKKDRNK
jgi:hypothetical protein